MSINDEILNKKYKYYTKIYKRKINTTYLDKNSRCKITVNNFKMLFQFQNHYITFYNGYLLFILLYFSLQKSLIHLTVCHLPNQEHLS